VMCRRGAVSAATAAIHSVASFYVVRTLLGVFESGTFGSALPPSLPERTGAHVRSVSAGTLTSSCSRLQVGHMRGFSQDAWGLHAMQGRAAQAVQD